MSVRPLTDFSQSNKETDKTNYFRIFPAPDAATEDPVKPHFNSAVIYL